jgi:hypothetical protein
VLPLPSPKFHCQALAWPLVVLVNTTLNGAIPLVVLMVKLGAGGGGAAVTTIDVGAVLLALPPGPKAVSTTV